ncbi:MAG: LysM peptidoglycan-binding domain-containing protein, partial [Pseudomonadota bacterium]
GVEEPAVEGDTTASAVAENDTAVAAAEQDAIDEAPVARLEEGTEDLAAEPATEAPEVDVAVAEEAPEEAPTPLVAEPASPTVMLADGDGVRILQQGGDGPEAVDNVSIDSISYDSTGEVALAGRSVGDNSVRVYIDNRPILDVEAAEDGQWRANLPEIDTGTYTLRVDEITADGSVVSRAETPFRREAVAAIRALDTGATEAAPVALITVQPGNTLWGIAREKYGEGPLYVRVFEANSDRIRNPDLIYPGQIFTVPN